MPRKRTAAWILCLCAFAGSTLAEENVFYVSPAGNDAWTGTKPAPTPGADDGPWATLARAQQGVRATHGAQPGQAVTVLLRDGRYPLAAPLVFTPEDSGSPDATVTWAAFPGEHPVLDGGRRIEGFRVEGDRWKLTLPEVAAGKWAFSELFVAGQRRQRARTPNTDFLRMSGPAPPVRDASGQEQTREKTAFAFRRGDLRPWAGWQDAQVTLMHSWENSIHRISSIDEEQCILTLASPLKEWWTIGYWERAARYSVENFAEALDAPGEWFLDVHTGELTYLPMPGETPEQTDVVAPVTGAFLLVEGKPDDGRFVDDLVFRGLTFQHADWRLAPAGNSSTQAAVEVPATVTADGARRLQIADCTLAHTGTYGVWFRRGCVDCRIERCELFDLGAGGVRLGEAAMPETEAALTRGCVVDNNHIHHYGEVYPAGVGVFITQASDSRVSHNTIHDGYYTGVSIGWNWGDGPTRAHGNRIEFNHIHHVLRQRLSDGAGIYTLGTSPGTVLRNNLIHDVFSYDAPYLAWGIYLDAVSNQILVENNVCYDVQNGGLMFHNGSFENTIRNNIFARSATQGVWRSLPQKGSNTFERNIVYLTQGDFFLVDAQPDLKSTWNHNLYWRTDGRAVALNGLPLAEWQAKGPDRDSLVADPRFADPDSADFRLAPDSPAVTQLGFAPIDTAQCGVYGDPQWVARVNRFPFEKTVLPPPVVGKPHPVHDDFETTPAGLQPESATVSGEGKGASIRVAEGPAASGRQSVRVVDAAGLAHTWEPHFYYQPAFTEGVARTAMQLNLGPGSVVLIEWRGGGVTGPSLRIDERGQLVAGGRVLLSVPREKWFALEIVCPLGSQAQGTYDLTVALPGSAPQHFEKLPCSQAFQLLDWFGLVSLPDAPCEFRVDDMEIGVKE